MSVKRLAGPIALGLAVVLVVVGTRLRNGDDGTLPAPTGAPTGAAVVTVNCYVGGEKMNFLANPMVQQILAREGLAVNARRPGSIEMVRSQALTDEDDCLWPSNQVALALYKQRGGQLVKAENVFNSPMMIYSWATVTDALTRLGLVQQVGDTYYVVDFPRLVQLIVEGTTWAEVGLPDLNGRLTVHTTDPTLSNSGNMFAGLLATALNGGEVVDATSVERVLPALQQFFGGWGSWNKVRPTSGSNSLYPRPTVWSQHPLIARTEKGARLLDVLIGNKELQNLAWTQHGSRSGLIGVQNDPSVLQVSRIAPTIESVVDMPAPDVMDRIITALWAPPATPPALSDDPPPKPCGGTRSLPERLIV
jgi:hypothetical protein